MWRYPKIIAHRGAGTLAPENTIAAMRCGHAHGHRAVEFDVMLSQDGVPVVMHDPALGRTVAGSGSVSDYSASELSRMDAGSWFSAEFAGERVPTYEQVFQYCMENRMWMNVEIKPVPGFESITGRVVAEYTSQYLASSDDGSQVPLFSSFSFDALLAAKAAAPDIPRGMLVREVPADWRERMAQLEAVAVDASYWHMNPARAEEIKQSGFGLFCYTVNDVATARELFSWGVDAICTDRIDLFAPDFA